jgi:hypothetical protein
MCQRSGFLIAIRPSNRMARGIRPVWRIWHATRPSHWSTVQTLDRKSLRPGRNDRRFAISTVTRKKRELENQLSALLAATTGCDLARELQAKMARARDQLLTFCDFSGQVDVTNNTSERKLRPCVIQREVTRLSRHVGRTKPKPTSEPQSTPRGSRAQTPSTSSSPSWPDLADRRAPTLRAQRGWIAAFSYVKLYCKIIADRQCPNL